MARHSSILAWKIPWTRELGELHTVYPWGCKESDTSWQLNHPLQEWSLFPPVLWKSCNQIPLALKVRFPGDSQSLFWTPRLGSLTWGSEPSQQWESFCGLVVLQFLCCPPGGYGIWFYCDCSPSPVWCGFSFVFGRGVYFFGGFLHCPVHGYSAASWDFGVLSGGDECTSFHSAILNQSSLLLLFLKNVALFFFKGYTLFLVTIKYLLYLRELFIVLKLLWWKVLVGN